MFLNDGVSEKDEARVRVCACVCVVGCFRHTVTRIGSDRQEVSEAAG